MILKPYKIIDTGSMAGDVTSSVANVQGLDNISLQFIWTSTAVGTFSVQGSMDYELGVSGSVVNAGTWKEITLDPAPVAAGVAGNILINLNFIGFPYIRVVYTRTSSSGTLNAYIGGKKI